MCACFLHLPKTGRIPAKCSLLRFRYKSEGSGDMARGSIRRVFIRVRGRPGWLTSSLLFCFYVDTLIEGVSSIHMGCHIDGHCVNNVSYADDMVPLAPSVTTLRQLVSSCGSYVEVHGSKNNAKRGKFSYLLQAKVFQAMFHLLCWLG